MSTIALNIVGRIVKMLDELESFIGVTFCLTWCELNGLIMGSLAKSLPLHAGSILVFYKSVVMFQICYLLNHHGQKETIVWNVLLSLT